MLITENGTGSDANSYVSQDQAAVFFTERNIDPPNSGHLLQSMDHIESLKFLGKPTEQGQPLQFPRSGIVDINSIEYAPDVVPKAVLIAQMWLAYYIKNGFDPTAVATQAIKKEKVDVLETEFFGDNGTGASMVAYSVVNLPNLYNAIRHLLDESDIVTTDDLSTVPTGFSNGRVTRA